VLLGFVGGIVVIIVIAAVATSGKSPSSNTTGATTGSGSGNYNPPAAASSAPPSAAPSSPAAPQYTVSQQQAIDSAQSYLSTEPGFSYLGLIGQLDSSAVGFSVADATTAVNAIAPAGDTSFWNAQAVDSAKDYMQTEPGWSACGLVQQLDSSAVQFTQAEAEYAVQQVGLGSC
jgi:Host cell surface-exposed lipoprotein